MCRFNKFEVIWLGNNLGSEIFKKFMFWKIFNRWSKLSINFETRFEKIITLVRDWLIFNRKQLLKVCNHDFIISRTIFKRGLSIKKLIKYHSYRPNINLWIISFLPPNLRSFVNRCSNVTWHHIVNLFRVIKIVNFHTNGLFMSPRLNVIVGYKLALVFLVKWNKYWLRRYISMHYFLLVEKK